MRVEASQMCNTFGRQQNTMTRSGSGSQKYGFCRAENILRGQTRNCESGAADSLPASAETPEAK